jgi:hypothetical protein
MTSKTLGNNKAEAVYLSCKSAESSASIPRGTPVALVMNATNDGLAVVLPSTATATKAEVLAFGVTPAAIAAGNFGKVQAYGFCRNAVLVKRTRSATDADWASTAAAAVGAILTIDTVDNCFRVQGNNVITVKDITGTAASDSVAASITLNTIPGFAPMAVLCEAVASSTTNTSATSFATGTVSTGLVKVFLRML